MLVDHLLKRKKEYKSLKKQEFWKYIFQNGLDKACFQHDIVFRGFEDLARKTASDKILHHKAFDIAKSLKYDGYQGAFASIIYKFFDKKSALRARSENVVTRDKPASGNGVKNENISNKELAEELREPIIRKNFLKKYTYLL